MKIINQISKSVEVALASQAVLDKKYRLITYIMHVPTEEGILVHNFLTGQTIFLTSEEFSDFSACKKGELYTFFIQNWFYVLEEQNDRALYEIAYAVTLLFEEKRPICNFTIFPTTDCNARCFYCFENGKRRYHMNEKTALDVAKYIIEVSNGAPVYIQWFGGEPLYNQKAINVICKYLLENNVLLKTSMISNGYLFDESLINHAIQDWHLSLVQITLDGTQDVYNRTKNYIYKDDKNPFMRVIHNIKLLLAANVKVYIRINLEKHNAEDIMKLVDYIEENIGPSSNLLVYSWLLYDSRLSGNKKRDMESKRKLTETQIDLANHIVEHRLRFVKPITSKMITKSCMAEDESSITILPDGHIGKCDHYLESDFIGSIYEDKPFDPEILKRWKVKRDEVELCKMCCLFPYCRKLKNCPETGEEICDEIIQSFYLNHARLRILAAYHNFINSKDQEGS